MSNKSTKCYTIRFWYISRHDSIWQYRTDKVSTKFFYCFGWGVRNISNFGTNLETSSYVWENCFALLISIIGLLLFLYLIGNVQLYLKSKADQILFAQEVRANKLHRVERKIREWTARNGIPEEMIMTEIMKNVKQKLEEINYADEDENVNLKYVLSNLPWYLRKRVQWRLCMDGLEKVPMLRNMERKGLKMICEYLRPMIYCQDQIIVQAGKPLDLMFIVIEGTVRCVDAIGNAAPQLQKGYFFGEELFTSESRHPISVQTVICETEVEAFILRTEDLRNLVRTSQFLRNLMEEQL
ncbi:cyclic nucleotide-gated ion channel 1-like [Rosa chinensis]|uniref:cyclic nucleotide-gated ion channel 1-like n=1 Tax=Rosa chinensis TaxID=74649 RepID=UPI000D0881A9|nr:cyclic nucleotide-gated ion channel 1-like [Rosa chinensis]